MKTTARIVELLLTLSAVVYSGYVTKKWVQAEKSAAYLAGQRDLWETTGEAVNNPKRLSKW